MFLPPKNVIAICVAAACLLANVSANAQSSSQRTSEFNRRKAAIERARQRTQHQPVARVSLAAAQGPASTATEVVPTPVVVDQPVNFRSEVVPATQDLTTARALPRRGFIPSHMRTRTAQVLGGPIIGGGAPIIVDPVINAPVSGGSSTREGVVLDGPISHAIQYDGPAVGSEVIHHDVHDGGGYIDGSCGEACGEIGNSFFDDGCYDCEACPVGTPFWLNGLARTLRRAEYFGGFTAFRSNLFENPVDGTDLIDDSSHGVFAGFNLGVPLQRLTGGLLSGQFGVRSVNTNFSGAAFTPEDRNQVFLTAGLFRRVDYGLQFGVVADVLREEWITSIDLVQIRGDISYVWPNRTTFGFRFANNVQDDPANGTFNGTDFAVDEATSSDWYRFYLRHDLAAGGYGEVFAGWTENEQGILGLNMDFPITDRLAFDSGFTYFIADETIPTSFAAQNFGGDPLDGFNVFVGFSVRPRGRASYQGYDRPLFDVADNGTMLIVR